MAPVIAEVVRIAATAVNDTVIAEFSRLPSIGGGDRWIVRLPSSDTYVWNTSEMLAFLGGAGYPEALETWSRNYS